MKIKIRMILLLFVMFFIPKTAYAAGGFSVSPSNINLNPGGTATVTIYTDNAVGVLNITSSSPDVATASMATTFIQQPGQSQAFTITANSEGYATINVTATNNFATMDEEVLGGETRTITVNVTSPQPTTPTEPSNPNPANNEPTKSNNTNMKKILISDKEPTRIDDDHFTITVSNSVTIITLSAEAEDEKTTFEGIGDHELKIGDNEIELKVIAESGAERIIKIVVTRRKGYAISDLDDILKDKPEDVVDLIISQGEVLDENTLNKIKSSRVLVNFNYFNVEEELRYSWQIDGASLRNTKGFNTKVEIIKDYLETIDKASNYAKGVNIKLSNKIDNPKGIKLKVFIGDQYKSGDLVNIYSLRNDKLYLKNEKIKVDAGYIIFDISSDTDYFITQSELNKKTSDNSSYLFTSIIQTMIIIIMLVIVIIMGRRLNNLTHNKTSNAETSTALNKKAPATDDNQEKQTIGETIEVLNENDNKNELLDELLTKK